VAPWRIEGGARRRCLGERTEQVRRRRKVNDEIAAADVDLEGSASLICARFNVFFLYQTCVQSHRLMDKRVIY